MSRRVFLLLVVLAGCRNQAAPPAATPDRETDPVRRALTAGARFLVSKQDGDGAWRSDFYGSFKDGVSLTPLVLLALHDGPHVEGLDRAYPRGVAYLAKLNPADHLDYPVYTAALIVRILSQPGNEEYRTVRDAWLTFLRQRQLTEELGWEPADRPYGGWGYCAILPRKPAAGEGGPPLLESNLSATRFALEALRAANVPARDPAYARARIFLSRCQNFAVTAEEADASFDDGGFFFINIDTTRNKAGVAGTDRHGRERYHSYGSATADGLLALLLCGLPADEPAVRAARAWLESRFQTDAHPGQYAANREHERDAVYFYYCQAAARALHAAGVEQAGPGRWNEALAAELIKRQKPDGSWSNSQLAQRENDPLVATSAALSALNAVTPRVR